MAYNFQKVIDALEYTITAHELLSGVHVDQAVKENTDPDKCPWAGIYLEDGLFEPWTVSAGERPWRIEGDLHIVLQEVDHQFPVNAQRAMFQLLNRFMVALGQNLTLKGDDGIDTVKMVAPADFVVEYQETGDAAAKHYFQSIDLTLKVEERA